MDINQTRNILLCVCLSICALVAFLILRVRSDRIVAYSIPTAKDKAVKVKGVKGLYKKKILTNRNGTTLQIELKSTGRCMDGDLDLVEAELAASKPGTKLILTLEGMNKNTSFPRQWVEVFPSDIKVGKVYNINFPVQKKPVELGLYLCQDSSGKNSCKNKPFMDYDNLHNIHIHGEKNDDSRPQYFSHDQLFYFGYLLVDHNSASTIPMFSRNENYRELSKHLKEIGADVTTAEFSIKRLALLHNKLFSMGIDPKGANFTADLPHTDGSTCKSRTLYIMNKKRSEVFYQKADKTTGYLRKQN